MFLAMKSRRRQGPAKPCPCNKTCPCHKPRPSTLSIWEIITFTGLILFIIGDLGWCISHPPQIHRVKYNSQDCTLETKTDSCTSTGFCTTHDEVVCP